MFSFSSRQAKRRAPLRSPVALRLEPLEDRSLMSASPGAAEPAPIATANESGPPAGAAAVAIVSGVDLAGDARSSARQLGALSGTVTASDAVSTSDPTDFYRFSVTTTADFRVTLSGTSADLDVQLLNSRGRVIASSAASGAGQESLDLQLKKGTYFVRVAPYYGAESDYTLALTATLDQAGDSRKAAAACGDVALAPVVASDRVGGLDKHDFYRITLTQTETVRIALGQLTQNADLTLLDARGRKLATSANFGTTAEELVRQLSAGVYYVVVDPADYATTSYRLSIEGSAAGGTTPTTPTSPTSPTSPTTPSTPSGAPLPAVPNYGGSNDWNLNAINAPEAWAKGYTGRGVIVAVVDTGIDFNHPELSGNLWTNAGEIAGNGRDDDGNGYADDVRGWDFANGDADPRDDHGHGTSVAGVIAAERNSTGPTGVAYDAVIMPVKIFGSSGTGSPDDVAKGIRYAADNGARVINVSIGGGSSPDLEDAIRHAASKNVLIVAASGNDGSATPAWPARYSSQFANVISVGAHDSSNALAYFSNKVGGSGAVQVDAPGVSVYSTVINSQYGPYNGTSMAAPHVAGLAALMLSANPSLTASQLRSLIVSGADRAITRSDSRGGVDAAVSVGAALNPSAASSSVASASIASGDSTAGAATATVATLTAAVVATDVGFSVGGERPGASETVAATPAVGRAAAVEAAFAEFGGRGERFPSDASLESPFARATSSAEREAIDVLAEAVTGAFERLDARD